MLTYEAITDLLLHARAQGINTLLARGDPHIFRILDAYEKVTGERLQWIAQTAPERGDPLESIYEIAQHNPIAIYIHGRSLSEGENAFFDRKSRSIPRAPEFLQRIHSYGVLAGLGSHDPEAIAVAEARGYGADFYVQSLNSVSYCCLASPARVSEVIRETPKPVFLIKVLAAARVPPQEAIPTALRLCKPNDCLVVGMAVREEIEENATLLREAVEANLPECV